MGWRKSPTNSSQHFLRCESDIFGTSIDYRYHRMWCDVVLMENESSRLTAAALWVPTGTSSSPLTAPTMRRNSVCVKRASSDQNHELAAPAARPTCWIPAAAVRIHTRSQLITGAELQMHWIQKESAVYRLHAPLSAGELHPRPVAVILLSVRPDRDRQPDKESGWRKVWKDEPRILLTARGRFFPSSLSLRSTFTRSSSSSEQSAAARWLGRVGPATGPVYCRATAASFQIKGRTSTCARELSLAAWISNRCFSLSV